MCEEEEAELNETSVLRVDLDQIFHVIGWYEDLFCPQKNSNEGPCCFVLMFFIKNFM